MSLIQTNEGFGTGFFIEIPIPSKKNPTYGLITNNHVLNKNHLKTGKSFKIYTALNKNESIEIQINEEDFVFTSELIDITFIELNDEIIDEIKPRFLHPSPKDAKVNDSIIIFQYPNTEYSLAHGSIKEIHGFNYYHQVSTDSGSSGSPLLNEKFEVVGIHKSRKIIESKDNENNNNDNKNSNNNDDVEMNVAVKYTEVEFALKILYNNRHEYGIERAKRSSGLLYDEEIKVLENYGLHLKLSLEKIKAIENKKERKELHKLFYKLFYCKFSKNEILFYRTNYAWYLTLLSKKNTISISNYLNNIKYLDWCPLKPNSDELDKEIDSKINGREYVLITWLKLTEFMYL